MMSCICYGAMFGWDVPLQVDPLLLAMFVRTQSSVAAKPLRREQLAE